MKYFLRAAWGFKSTRRIWKFLRFETSICLSIFHSRIKQNTRAFTSPFKWGSLLFRRHSAVAHRNWNIRIYPVTKLPKLSICAAKRPMTFMALCVLAVWFKHLTIMWRVTAYLLRSSHKPETATIIFNVVMISLSCNAWVNKGRRLQLVGNRGGWA